MAPVGRGYSTAPNRTVLESFLDSLRTVNPAQDVAARLGEHKAAIGEDFSRPGGGTLKGVFDLLVGTGLGLPLEAGNTVARMATGSGLAGLGAVTHGTPLQAAPNEAAYQAFMKGSRDSGSSLIDVLTAANEAAAGAGGHSNIGTGVLNAVLDPTNLVTFGGGKVAQAAKAERLAGVQSAGGKVAPAVFDAIMDDKLAKLTGQGVAAMETVRKGEGLVAFLKRVDEAAAAERDAMDALRADAGNVNTAHLQGIKDKLAGLDDAQRQHIAATQARAQAEDELTRVQDAFRTSKDASPKDEFPLPYKNLTKEERELYSQRKQAKRLEVIPKDILDSLGEPPSGKDAFQAWTSKHYQTFKDMEAKEKALLLKLQEALPEGVLDAYKAKPAEGPGVMADGSSFAKAWANAPDDPNLIGLNDANTVMNAQMESVGAGPGIAPESELATHVANRPLPAPGVTPPTVAELGQGLQKGAPGITIEGGRLGPEFGADAGQWGLRAYSVFRDQQGEVRGVLRMTLDDAGKPEILEVAVDPTLRRQGIGSSLYKAAADAGYDVEAASGAGGLTEDGAAFQFGRQRAVTPTVPTAPPAVALPGETPGTLAARLLAESGATPGTDAYRAAERTAAEAAFKLATDSGDKVAAAKWAKAVNNARIEHLGPEEAQKLGRAEMGQGFGRALNNIFQGGGAGRGGAVLPGVPPTTADDAATVAPEFTAGLLRPHKRSVFEQLMVDLGDTGDDPDLFRRKVRIAEHILGKEDVGGGNTGEFVVRFADGPIISPEMAARLMGRDKRAARRAFAELAQGVPSPAQPLLTAPPDSPEAIQQVAATVANATPADVPKEASGWRAFTSAVVQEMVTAQKEAMGMVPDALPQKATFKALVGAGKGALVETPRNAIIDPIFNNILGASENLPKKLIGKNVKLIRDNFAQGERNPLFLLGEMNDDLAATGLLQQGGKELTQDVIKEYTDGIGASFYNEAYEAARHLSAQGQLLANLLAGLANPLRGTVSLATAPLGYLAPMRARAFHIINNLYHNAARSAAFSDAFRPYIKNSADNLLAAAASEGKDVSKFANLSGRFSADEVRAVLGDRYADEWTRFLEEARQAGFARAKYVFGDYSKRGPVESALSSFFPFMSWSWRALPRSLRMLAENPMVSTALLHLYIADAAVAKAEGRPSYQAGTLEFNKDTPLVGILASLLSPDQEASIRVNPAALFTPLSAGGFVGLSDSEEMGDKNLYQTLNEITSIFGAGFNPAIQGGAYVTGADYRSPNPLSRYNAVDQLVGDITGHALDVPTIQGPLRAAREALTGERDTFDPVKQKANELVYERTGVPVADARNKEYAKQIAKKEGIYKEAQLVLDKSGALRAGFNAVTPITAQVTTATTKARQQASQGLPHSYEEIQAAKASDPTTATIMELDNLLYQQQHPAAAINMKPTLTKQDTQDERLTRFERENAYMKEHAPAFYAKQLAAYKASIGLR